MRQVQSEKDGTDLAQERFVRVYKHRARFDARQKFTTCFYTIATNAARDPVEVALAPPRDLAADPRG